uniref:Rad51-like C-terminal domain-containing protein n=1 Tax=Anopheles farauti TaxID=69004 RepID=A0A182Q035_9DIPT
MHPALTVVAHVRTERHEMTRVNPGALDWAADVRNNSLNSFSYSLNDMGDFIESAYAFVTRTISRSDNPPVHDLHSTIFPNGGLRSGEFVEISGESNSGKSLLLLELIARIILPSKYGGLGLAAVMIDCENSYHEAFLLSVMEKHIVNRADPTVANTLGDRQQLESIQRAALERLHLITCYSLEQLELTLIALPKLFVKHQDVSFMLIDSIATFYWTKCTAAKLIRQQTYQSDQCKALGKLARTWGKVLLYTKPAHFGSRPQQLQRDFELTGLLEAGSSQASSFSGVYPTSSGYATKAGKPVIDWRIELSEILNPSPRSASDGVPVQRFTALINGREKQYVRFYLIDKYGISWIES